MAMLTSDKNDKRGQEAEAVAEAAAREIQAECESAAAEPKKRRAQSYWAVSWNIFKKNKLGMVCLIVVVLLVLIAIFAPLLAPYDPYAQELANRYQAPCAAHPFGTDEFGRDLLSRTIYGCRISLSVGVVSQAIAIVVMFVMGPGLINLYVALGLLMWTRTARLVRGDVMRLKSSEYIQSCILSGGSSWRIIIKHLLPNCVSTLIVTSTLGIPNAILSEASLSFLGLGVQPPMASWGQMISAARSVITSNTYYSVIPGVAIIITVMAFNLLGDALRDALDPKMRS